MNRWKWKSVTILLGAVVLAGAVTVAGLEAVRHYLVKSPQTEPEPGQIYVEAALFSDVPRRNIVGGVHLDIPFNYDASIGGGQIGGGYYYRTYETPLVFVRAIWPGFLPQTEETNWHYYALPSESGKITINVRSLCSDKSIDIKQRCEIDVESAETVLQWGTPEDGSRP